MDLENDAGAGGPDTPSRTQWRYVAAGGAHTCALSRDGRVACWGANETLQVGAECAASSTGYPEVPACWRPVGVAGLEYVVHVACGGTVPGSGRSCAVVDDGTVFCWGLDPGSEWYGAGTTSLMPTPVAGLPAVTKIAVSPSFACALSRDGRVYCWGVNYSGVLGRPYTEIDGSDVPLQVELPLRATDVVTGGLHACALLEDGKLWCWGSNDQGQLGIGLPIEHGGRSVIDQTSIPAPVPLEGVFAAATGDHQMCALSGEGTVSCWGNKSRGSLGLPNVDEPYTRRADEIEPLPTPVPNAPVSTALAVGYMHVCVSDRSGNPWCWGDNLNDQVLNGPSQLPPTRLDGIANVEQIDAADYHTCFLTAEGRILCSGFAAAGELGGGEMSDNRGYLVPVLEPVEP